MQVPSSAIFIPRVSHRDFLVNYKRVRKCSSKCFISKFRGRLQRREKFAILRLLVVASEMINLAPSCDLLFMNYVLSLKIHSAVNRRLHEDRLLAAGRHTPF